MQGTAYMQPWGALSCMSAQAALAIVSATVMTSAAGAGHSLLCSRYCACVCTIICMFGSLICSQDVLSMILSAYVNAAYMPLQAIIHYLQYACRYPVL